MAITTPRIAILGAGPAGLTLAALLSKHSPSTQYTIFDLRPAPTSSSPTSPSVPSGSLDLHEESGQLALRECGLYDEFFKLKPAAMEDMILADKHAHVHYTDDGQGQNRPEIARNDLLALLLSVVPPENLKWSHKVVSITTHDSRQNATRTLHFEGGSTFKADLVVGADGAWSKVRSLITETKPYFSSMNCISLTIPHISTQHPKLAALIGKGTYTAASDFKAVMAQNGTLDSVRIYLMIQSASATYLDESGIQNSSPADLERILLSTPEIFSTWAPQLQELITAGCHSAIAPTTYPLNMLPIDFTFAHTPGLTLIGDAAHIQTPFAGEGVNAAMLDALELSRAIVQHQQGAAEAGAGEMDRAIAAFEKDMFARMHPIMAETLGNLHMIFAADAPKPFVEFFESHGPPPED